MPASIEMTLQMEELGRLKKELKLWEADFYQKFERKPQKEDLENAPNDVLASYQRYKEIKKTVEATSDSSSKSSESLTSTSIDVWGKDLNKATPGDKNAAPVSVANKGSSSVMKGLGKKILQNSLLLKVPPVSRRSLCGSTTSSSSTCASNLESKRPNIRKRPEELPTVKSAVASELSQLSEISSATNSSLFDRALKIVNSKKQEPRKSVSDTGPMVPSLLLGYKTGAQRKSFLSSCSSLFQESSQICDEHGDGQLIHSVEGQQGHAAESQHVYTVKGQHSVQDQKRHTTSLSKELINCKELPCDETVLLHSASTDIDLHMENSAECSKQLSSSSENKRRPDENAVFQKINTLQSVSYASPTVRRTNFKAASFSIAENCDVKTMSKTNIKRTHSEVVDGDLDDENVQRTKRKRLNDAEFSLQPDATEDDNLTDEETVGDRTDLKTTERQSHSKSGETKKRPPGNARSAVSVSSGNFVRLNMKLKRYKRKGGRPTSGPAAKRLAWKQKMQSRNKSRGSSCFKCGEEGHWAKDCKGKFSSGGNNWSSRKEFEEWDDNALLKEVKMEEFPTLEEAVGMAKGIRKSSSDPTTPAPGTAEKSNEEFELTFNAERTLYEPKASLPTMEPLYHLNEDGSLPKPPLELMKALKKFGFSRFRLGQEMAIMRVLCGLSTLVVLSTGAGKSLCYQLSAYMYAQRDRCITLVISPLVSLMQDQVTNLPPGINGACVNANMSAAQRASVLESVSSGKVQFLLLSPEMLVSGSGSSGSVNLLKELPPVAFACIDEAHCVSEWSHHFRPSYLTVCKVLRERYGVKCLLGLTATATMATAISISHHLGITDCDDAIIRGAPIPPNLKLSVSRDENKEEALVGLLRGELYSSCQSIIVYCTRREETARVATLIRTCLKDNASDTIQIDSSKGSSKKKRGRRNQVAAGQPLPWDAEYYHAGLTAAQRKKIQTDFMSGYLRVVVATVAFGMGLDKSDIRGIIHYNISKTVESYIQEIGRAGRDGKVAYCHLFLDSQGQDNNELRRHIYSRSVDRSSVKKLVRRVFMSCRCRYLHNLTMEKKTSVANEDEFDFSELDKPWDVVEQTSETTVSQDVSCAVTKGCPTAVECSNEFLKNSFREPDMEDERLTNLKYTEAASLDDERIVKGHENDEFNENSVMEEELSAEAAVEREPTELEMELSSGLLSKKSDSNSDNDKEVSGSIHQKRRICPGHERAIPIEELVRELDMKEEGISTLLCYLELHPDKWIYNLQPVYANCKIQCYRGLTQLQAIAKKCPPIAVAIARQKGKTIKTLEFNVVELSDFMGWESGPVKRELKLLQWEAGPSGLQKSGVLVEFRDLAFHLRSPGDLMDDEIDEVINFLVERLETQERTELFHLQNFYQMLQSVSYKSCWSCIDRIDEERSERLKQKLQEYLECGRPLENSKITAISFSREMDVKMTKELNEPKCDYESTVRADISAFIHIYRPDHALTGRAIARVMHGIESPCFPAAVWGKVRRFWRCHLDVDFNLLRKIATEEMIRTR